MPLYKEIKKMFVGPVQYLFWVFIKTRVYEMKVTVSSGNGPGGVSYSQSN